MIDTANKKFYRIIYDKIRLPLAVFLVLMFFIATYTIFLKDILWTFEEYSYDIRTKIINSKQKQPDVDIKTILFGDLSDNFINEHPELELTRWPLPRSVWGDINNYLIRANAKVIIYDINFTSKTTDYDDDYFAKTIKDSGEVYLSFIAGPVEYYAKNFAKQAKINLYFLKKQKLIDILYKIIDAINNREAERRSYAKASEIATVANIDYGSLSRSFILQNTALNIQLPYSKFLNKAKNLGFTNISKSNDHVFRYANIMSMLKDDKLIFSLPVIPVIDTHYTSNTPLTVADNNLIFPDRKIPLDENGNLIVNWLNAEAYAHSIPFIKVYLYEKYYTIDAQTGYKILPEEQNYFMQPAYQYLYKNLTNIKLFNIKHLELLRINFVSDYYLSRDIFPKEYLSSSINQPYFLHLAKLFNYGAIKVSNVQDEPLLMYPLLLNHLENSSNQTIINYSPLQAYRSEISLPEYFCDTYVIIGEGRSTGDIHKTPIKLMPGPLIFANVLDNLLNDKVFIHKSSNIANFAIIILLITLSILIIRNIKNNIVIILTFVSLILSYVIISVMLFYKFLLWIPVVNPIFLVTIFFIFALITQNLLTKEKLDKTYKLATTDGLTGLYNHRFFQEKMSLKLDEVKRKEDFFSLLLIDIDFFKKFNDTYGHRAGDAVLVQVATLLKLNVREYDVVCRYGGEEMCVILDKTDTKTALDVAQKLVNKVASNDFNIETDDGYKIVKVTISVGASNYPDHAKEVPSLIEFADQCLYRAKEGGRNRVGNLEDEISETTGTFISKELEIEKEKMLKSIGKILPVCRKYNIDAQELLQELYKKAQEEEQKD
jgi:diguanylate cyclase (GGDEF)-like protein